MDQNVVLWQGLYRNADTAWYWKDKRLKDWEMWLWNLQNVAVAKSWRMHVFIEGREALNVLIEDANKGGYTSVQSQNITNKQIQLCMQSSIEVGLRNVCVE